MLSRWSARASDIVEGDGEENKGVIDGVPHRSFLHPICSPIQWALPKIPPLQLRTKQDGVAPVPFLIETVRRFGELDLRLESDSFQSLPGFCSPSFCLVESMQALQLELHSSQRNAPRHCIVRRRRLRASRPR